LSYSVSRSLLFIFSFQINQTFKQCWYSEMNAGFLYGEALKCNHTDKNGRLLLRYCIDILWNKDFSQLKWVYKQTFTVTPLNLAEVRHKAVYGSNLSFRLLSIYTDNWIYLPTVNCKLFCTTGIKVNNHHSPSIVSLL
jgi:hypothetical protein